MKNAVYFLTIFSYFKLQGVFTVGVDYPISKGGVALSEKFWKILQSQIDLHIKPATFWIVDGSNPIEYYENLIFKNDLNPVPLVHGNFSQGIRNLDHYLSSFIFIVFVPSDILQLPNLIHEVQEKGNRRRDRFIFIGNESTLKSLFQSSIVIGLRNKIGISVNTGVILVDPELYDPGNMVTIQEIYEMNPRPLMGQNIRGRHLKVTGSVIPPYIFIVSPETAPELGYSGTNYNILLESSRKFNFTFEIQAPAGQGYGELLENGTWTGMIGDILYPERNFDLVLLLGHFPIWYDLLDFASTFDFIYLAFFTSHPQSYINWEAFINPFTGVVWASIIVTYIVMSISMFMVLHFSKTSQTLLSTKIIQAIQIPYSISVEQSIKIPSSIRSLSVIWMIAVIVTGIGYKCNLASYLSSPGVTSVPTTYEELAARNDYNVILAVLGETESSFFQTSTSPPMQQIESILEITPNPVECTRQALVNPKSACIGWSPVIEDFFAASFTLMTNLDALAVSKQAALAVSMSIAFQKNSILVDSFIPITSSIYEAGVYLKWKEEASYFHQLQGRRNMLTKTSSLEYLKLKEYEVSMGAGDFQSFSMKNLRLPFIFWALGVFMSIVGFVIEIGFRYFDSIRAFFKTGDPNVKNGNKVWRIWTHSGAVLNVMIGDAWK